ncbi:MAG: hypothetical protein QM654_01615 [Dysgonamonadaceae bacterium]
MIEINNDNTSLDRMIEGLRLSYERMLLEKQQNDESIVFSHDGRIIKVKARKLLPPAQDLPKKAIV